MVFWRLLCLRNLCNCDYTCFVIFLSLSVLKKYARSPRSCFETRRSQSKALWTMDHYKQQRACPWWFNRNPKRHWNALWCYFNLRWSCCWRIVFDRWISPCNKRLFALFKW
ncbi:unnamed protein product [Blepharisma stoltei]|uniref:Secreted protein n=1 Tax=Blepharisma stoltei TaxID=1481888 RepID=A0AAU9IXP2_9CILI|nr:unnamed protein product [Blepharisma stoltei]